MDTNLLNDRVRRLGRQVPDVSRVLALGFLPFAHSGNFGAWRSVVLWLGGWREDYPAGEDVEFAWRAQLAGFRMWSAPEALVHYRMRSTLGGWARQAFRYSYAHVLLFRDYREAGCRRRPLTLFLKQMAWLALNAPRAAVEPAYRWRWVRVASQVAGRLWGAVRARILYV